MEGLGLELSVLWTAVATFPFYELNGWQAVERFGATYPLRNADASRFAGSSGDVRRLADMPERVDDVLALHDAAGDHLERTPDQAAALFALPKVTTWLALDRGGGVAAYLVESRATNKPGLLDTAGDPTAIEGLIHGVLAALPEGATIDLNVGFAPDPLAAIAAERLADREPVPYGGNMMLRLNDPLGFLRSIRAWLAVHRPPDARSVSIRVVDADVTVSIEWRAFGVAIGSRELPEHMEMTRRELTSALFGAHADRPVATPTALAWLPRFHVPIPVLDRS